ncbi:hypothetical protein FACS189491_09230 [Spirochaetia bacterium]|nr:hypothetical protein FACS189491_09230 [Spirochaetia bacterium]
MNNFLKGVIAGAAVVLAAGFLIFAAWDARSYNREEKLLQETQHEIQEMRDSYGNRDPYEFLDDPGVRGAADGASEEFKRKRDEAIQRIRGGYTD